MKNTRCNLILLKILAFVLSIAPIIAVVAWNWDDYTISVVQTIKLSIGLVICLIFLLFKCLGRLKLPEKRIFIYLIVFGMIYLLEAILNDMLIFSASALIGELLALPVEWKIKSMSTALHIDKTATATAKALDSKIEETIKKYTSSGRV